MIGTEAARDLTFTLARGCAESPNPGGTVNYVATYTMEELILDVRRRSRGEPLACPSCGWTDGLGRQRRLFDVYAERSSEGGVGYGYRLCKVCGFAQDADGGESYRVWLSAHECRPTALPLDQVEVACRHCRRTIPVVDGRADPHRCGKYLRKGDPGYCCVTCGEWQGPASATPLPGDRRDRVRRELHEETSAA